jgi:hypothetical protein
MKFLSGVAYQPTQPVAYLWDVLEVGPYVIYHYVYLPAVSQECSVSISASKWKVV